MRNRKKVQEKAFSNLISQLDKKASFTVEKADRFINTSSQDERNWMMKTKVVDKLYLTPQLRLIQLEFENNIYVAVIGTQVDSSTFDIEVIEEISSNAGIITLLISEEYIQLGKNISPLEFYDKILFQHVDSKYEGHNFLELLPFLEQSQLFLVPEDSIIKTQLLSRIAIYIFTIVPSQLVLDFSDKVIEYINELSLVGSDNITYKIVLGCLFSTTYNHAFLELYRLIERLFSINFLKEFHDITGTKLSFMDFSSQLENITKWRPSESDAIEKIFSIAEMSTQKHFENFRKTSDELKATNHSVYFYSFRNSIVHFRANHTEYKLNSKQWNLLLLATICLIDEQYSKHEEILKNKLPVK